MGGLKKKKNLIHLMITLIVKAERLFLLMKVKIL